MNIPKREIGQFCSNKRKLGDKVTVAMVQTLNRLDGLKEISDKFGTVLIDECHHMPAKMFRRIITRLNPFYLYGFTATPERKNNDTKLIFIYLGEILHEITGQYQEKSGKHKNSSGKSNSKIFVKKTDLAVPFKIKTDNFQVLSKIISFDSKRNGQIAEDINREASKGLKCLVLSERKEHLDVLSYYLKRGRETIIITGDLSEKQKREKIKQVEAGNFQILLATGQLIGEGTDFPNLDCLFLIFPFAFSGKLTQYIGRIQRGDNKEKIIYDYRDINVDFLEKLFKKRRKYYEKNFATIS